MNIVILGAGDVGRHVSGQLSHQGHNVQVIESDEDLADQLEQTLDAQVTRGDGSLAATLTEAQVPTCDLFVACTSGNNTNLVSSALAKKLGATKVVCRVHPSVESDFLINRRKLFGIDHIFSTEHLSVIELAKTIRNPEALLVEDIAQGRIEIQQVEVSEKSPVAGQSLLELKAPKHVRVVTISRQDNHHIPNASDTLRPGDIVTTLGKPKEVRELVRMLGKGTAVEKEQKVVILGGGQYGAALARVLRAGKLRIRIFEKSLRRCEELMQTFGRDATIIHADATDLNALREEQVGEADYFIATLADDADNVMACLQASDLGARHSLTLLHRADYAAAIHSFKEQVGIDLAVSPRDATLKHLQRFLTDDRYHLLRDLDAGVLLEASIPLNSKLAGREIREIKLPAGCLLVGHIHDIHADVPTATDVLNPGDNIIAMVAHDAIKRFVKLLGK